MNQHERTERIRQAIMRMRELLDLLRQSVDDGERAYEQLFAVLTDAEKDGLKEKEQQWLIAQKFLADPSPIAREALKLRFRARDLGRAFEEVHDNLVDA